MSTTDHEQPLLDSTPAHQAIMILATEVSKRLGTGQHGTRSPRFVDPLATVREGDGLLEGETIVSTSGMFGHDAVTTYPGNIVGATTVLLNDDDDPLTQLRALLRELEEHCVVGSW